MRTKKSKRILTLLIVALVILAAGCGFLGYMFKTTYDEATALTEELNSNTQTVYVASKFIEAGDTILAEGENANVELQTIYTGLESFNYITDEQLGSVCRVDCDMGTPIMFNMVSEEEFAADTREYEISVVNLATDQADNDYIDVRIAYPNGEDYIVLSKKKVSNLNLSACVFTTQANEEEILRMQSAIIDAYTMTGARIYSTRYVESNVQDDAIPTYLVRSETIDLINSDPNILTKATTTLNLAARLALETRLGNLTEEQLDAVAEGYGLADTAHSQIISGTADGTIVEEDEAATDDAATETTEEDTDDSSDSKAKSN